MAMAVAVAVALGLAGCADMSGIGPQASLRSAASLSLPSADGVAAAPALAESRWWQAWGDPQLDALMAQALQGNPGLKIAQARLARAQASADVARAASGPQFTATLDITAQRYTANGAVSPALAGHVRGAGTVQLSAGWELDFFGRHQAALDAALGAAQAAHADAQAARSLLAGNLVRAYVQLAWRNDQLALAQRTLAQRSQALQLVRDRVTAGLDTRLELRQSEGALPEARQRIEALHEAVALAHNAIAALTGQGARNLRADPGEPGVVARAPSLAALRSLPVPTRLPADLLAQRADVQAARWRVEAASQEFKSTQAQFYPNINLMAFAGLSSIGLGRLIESDSQQWGVGPALRLPVFDAGRLRAQLRGRAADIDAAVESYNQTLVEAVREVADQIASGQSIARQQAEQAQAHAAAQDAYDIALQRYRAGLGTYLHVLAAETAVLEQRRLALDLTARALDTQGALMRALGGGFGADAPSSSLAVK